MTAQTLTEYLSDAETALPIPFLLETMVSTVIRLHEENDGATFNPYFGDLSGQELYAVSVYPERTALEAGLRIDPAVLRQFIIDSAELLRDPRNNIGTWYDAENDETYLDVTTVLPDQGTVITLGIRYNQIAIYDLAGRREISTGGTGEQVADLLPEAERLSASAQMRGESSHERSEDFSSHNDSPSR